MFLSPGAKIFPQKCCPSKPLQPNTKNTIRHANRAKRRPITVLIPDRKSAQPGTRRRVPRIRRAQRRIYSLCRISCSLGHESSPRIRVSGTRGALWEPPRRGRVETATKKKREREEGRRRDWPTRRKRGSRLNFLPVFRRDKSLGDKFAVINRARKNSVTLPPEPSVSRPRSPVSVHMCGAYEHSIRSPCHLHGQNCFRIKI